MIDWAFFTVNDTTSQIWFESNVYESWNHSNFLLEIQRKIWNKIMPRLKLNSYKLIHPDIDRIIRSMQACFWWKETIWLMVQPLQTVLCFLLYLIRTFNSIHSRRNGRINGDKLYCNETMNEIKPICCLKMEKRWNWSLYSFSNHP